MRLNFGGVGEENYSNQSKDNYRGPSTTPLRGFAQDDGEKQTKATARAKSEAGFSAPRLSTPANKCVRRGPRFRATLEMTPGY